MSWTHGSARVVQAKNALRQKWRGKSLPDIATVCRPVRSSRRPAGYSADDASHAARAGARQQVSWPGRAWPLVQFCWHALWLCECARLHDAHTAAASACASITSVSPHTHWAQCRCHPAAAAHVRAWQIDAGRRPGRSLAAAAARCPCHAARNGEGHTVWPTGTHFSCVIDLALSSQPVCKKATASAWPQDIIIN